MSHVRSLLLCVDLVRDWTASATILFASRFVGPIWPLEKPMTAGPGVKTEQV